jgi:hypothetical protein
MSSFETPSEPPFAGGSGVRCSPRPQDDPYRTLDDLMAVIEALCPTWPQRGTFVSAGKMLL